MAGENADIAALLRDLDKPPISESGALEVDAFLPRSERRAPAAALNTLLASPSFASWRQGATLDIQAWLSPMPDGRTPAAPQKKSRSARATSARRREQTRELNARLG